MALKRIEQYCALLGVSPQATAEEIKRAFREKIKIYHPDTGSRMGDLAHEIIEAYNVLSNPKLREESRRTHSQGQTTTNSTAGHGPGSASRSAGAAPGWGGPGRTAGAAGASAARGARNTTGPVDKDHVRQVLSQFYERLAREGEGPVDPATLFAKMQRMADHYFITPFMEGLQGKEDPLSGASDTARRHYNRAEQYLQDIMETYNRQTNRPRKHRAQDYIRDLNQVKILFRDVANKNPSAYGAARKRIRDIDEMLEDVRHNML